MIKLENGIAEIRGPKIVVEAEFCALIKLMKELHGEEKVKELFELAMMSNDEVERRTKKMEEELAKFIGKEFTEHLNKALDSFMEKKANE